MVTAGKIAKIADPFPKITIPSTFSRSGVAYDPYGVSVVAGQSRHNMLVPTGTVTNILTGTQSDGGDTNNPELLTLNQQTGTDTLGNTTGFNSTGAGSSISSSTEQAYTGTRSLKCAVNGDNKGTYLELVTASASTAYIMGIWLYAPQNAVIDLEMQNNDTTVIATTTHTQAATGWEYVEVSGSTKVGASGIYPFIQTNGSQNISFYVDGCRLAKTDTTGYTATGSTISISPYDKYQGLRSLKVITNNSASGEGVNLSNATVTSGKQNTGHIAINAPNGAGLILRLYDGSTSTDQAITGTGAWQIVEVNKTPASTTLSLRVLTSSQQGITFYVDTLMIGVIT